jgi:hypothetical protein
MRAKVATSARERFRKFANVANGVLGGFVTRIGTVKFISFSPSLQGHLQAMQAGLVPRNCIGGFSVGVKRGKVAWFVFRSVLNHPNIYLHDDLQRAIIESLPKMRAWKVFE